jgi:hypothetical protein
MAGVAQEHDEQDADGGHGGSLGDERDRQQPELGVL